MTLWELAFWELFFIAGFLLAWKMYTDDAFLAEYMRNSPKAWVWRKVLGEERAVWFAKKILAPSWMVLTGVFGTLMAVAAFV